MADGADHDKSEPATHKKRQDARKKGQVAKSREIPSAVVLLGALTFFYFGSGWMFHQINSLTHDILQGIGQTPPTSESIHNLMWFLFQRVVIILAPLFIIIIILAVASNVAQVGFMLTGETLMPKLSKLNPLSGMKRLFSLAGANELVKAVLKIIIVGFTAYHLLRGELDKMPALMTLPTEEILVLVGKQSLRIGFYTCLVLLVLAGIDYLFQRWKYEHDLRMTKQEVKDEYKQREGDPVVRSRIRAAQREMAMKRMMQAVPKATVVITNPTHIAVALKFDRSMPAPQVVAKGAGKIAEKIKSLAQEYAIPIVEQKTLARSLFKNVEIDQFIPADLYFAVAEILAYVYRLKGIQYTRS
jgi:flagellar biosynthetic protein FlhB